mgnify:CR=1 FL=1
MQVVELGVYPIKSCRGLTVTTAAIAPTGFVGDREFVITDAQGQFLSQRQLPQLAQIQVTQAGEQLTLVYAPGGLEPLTWTPTDQGPLRPVQVWRDRTLARDQGEAVAQWLQRALALEAPVRLLRQSPQHRRPLDPDYATAANQPVSFADAFPFLITTTASLADLNRRLQAAYPGQDVTVPMNRFRPNIVIASEQPFAEDAWQTVQIGRVCFDTVKPCARCIVTTTDQRSGDRSPLGEPLHTLAQFRRVPKAGILFGVNAIARDLGTIQVGDPVQVLQGLPEGQP